MIVLLVDYDHGFLDQTKYVLETKWSDMDVIIADSTKKSIDILGSKDIEVVVCGYLKTKKESLDFLKEVRDNNANIPFILFTDKDKSAIQALSMGANRYIRRDGDPTLQFEFLALAIKQEVKKRKEIEHLETEIKRHQRIERRLDSMINNMDIAIVSLQKDMTLSKVNKSFENMVSCARENVEGKRNWLDFVKDDEKEKIKKHHKLRNIDPSLAPSSYTFHLITKYQEEKFVCASFTCDDDGSCLISIIDFTSFEMVLGELKKVEESLIGLRMGSPPETIPSFVKGIFDKNDLNRVVREWMLDEILLMLISLKEGASGKELMNELNKYFGLDLSSSIVYPALHRLEERSFLTMKEGIKTKQYRIKDAEMVQERIHSKLKEIYGAYVILKLIYQK